MAYINTAVSGSFAQIDIVIYDGEADYDTAAALATGANLVTVPALQEITLNATPGIFRWKQLDSLSEYAITTSSTNSVAATMVLDDAVFFTATGTTPGLFNIINDKQQVWFRLFFSGNSTGDRYVDGKAYLSGLAPTVSPDSPVWTSPVTLEIVGDLGQGVVA